MARHRRPLRIAYGRIAQETHAFSPVTSTLEDFRRSHDLEGAALARASRLLTSEAPGWTPLAELSGFVAAARRARRRVEAVPLFSAWALPSGPLAEDAYAALRARLVGALEAAGPLDGVFLSLHGAMRARGAQPEPEEGFVAATRAVIGPDTPLAVTFDLHGQMTPGKVDPVDVLVAYHTNPHRDLFGAGRRAGRALVAAAAGEVRPVTRWRALPMVMGGGTTVDLLAPMRAIFRRMKQMERDRRVLAANLFMCHLWNDSPDLGWSVVVVTDDAPQLADALADELAERAWSVRDRLPPSGLDPEQALAAVRRARVRRKLGTCCLCDASDVVGSGATGENTHLLRGLLEHGEGLRCYAPLLDAEAVDALWSQPEGSAVTMAVGGRLDPEMYPPLEARGRLGARRETAQFGRAVVLDMGHVQLVITERPPYTLRPSFYSDMGLDPWRADCVVVKSFFHFRIFYLAVNRASFLVRTRGLTDFDLASQATLIDPTHPFDAVEDWRAADRRRRGLSN